MNPNRNIGPTSHHNAGAISLRRNEKDDYSLVSFSRSEEFSASFDTFFQSVSCLSDFPSFFIHCNSVHHCITREIFIRMLYSDLTRLTHFNKKIQEQLKQEI